MSVNQSIQKDEASRLTIGVLNQLFDRAANQARLHDRRPAIF